MSVSPESNNATLPTPAIAPGGEDIDVRRAAERIAAKGMDARVLAAVPAFDAPFFQAGLAGYSDAAMRLIARRHGCPFCVTEALLDRTLIAGGRGFTKADLGELHENIPGGPEDHPLACQIMGSDPEEMAAAALKAAEQGKRGSRFYRRMAYRGSLSPDFSMPLRLPGGEQLDPTEGLSAGEGCEEETCETLVNEVNAVEGDEETERRRDEVEDERRKTHDTSSLRLSVSPELSFETIDVNLACPVKKIKSKARGGHWLADPEGAIEILRAVREAVPREIPCTVKLRRSFDDTPEMIGNIHRILEACEAMGYAWATVHARTVLQKYVGPSRWDLLKGIVAKHPGFAIFGSGDIWEAGDIFRMMEYTGVVGASVARGCIGNPWIFRQARDLLAGRDPRPPTVAEQRAVLEEHFRLLLAVNSGMRHTEETTSRMMRKFGIRFSVHHPRAEAVRRGMIAVASHADWEGLLAKEYSEGG